MSELPWAENPLSSVASLGCSRDSAEDRHREGDVSSLSSAQNLWEVPCEPGAVGRKSWKLFGN